MSIYTEPKRCPGCGQDFIPPRPPSGAYKTRETCSEPCRIKVAKRPRGMYVR